MRFFFVFCFCFFFFRLQTEFMKLSNEGFQSSPRNECDYCRRGTHTSFLFLEGPSWESFGLAKVAKIPFSVYFMLKAIQVPMLPLSGLCQALEKDILLFGEGGGFARGPTLPWEVDELLLELGVGGNVFRKSPLPRLGQIIDFHLTI